jgi:hypothetical protein
MKIRGAAAAAAEFAMRWAVSMGTSTAVQGRRHVEVRGEDDEDGQGAARGLEVREWRRDLTAYAAQMRCSLGRSPMRQRI